MAAGFPPTIVRVYHGAQQSDAVRDFQRDAAALAQGGYQPTSQSWAQGQWGCGAFLIALLLCLVLIGFLVFIYLLVVHPSGTLTVTYVYQGPARAPTPAPNSGPWFGTHRVPSGGMPAWNAPGESSPPATRLPEYLEVVVETNAGDWAQVRTANGWRGWVDGRALTERPAPPPPPTSAPPPAPPPSSPS
jgi:hypothetical protein